MFEPVRLRCAGDHDSYTRVMTVANVTDAECSPGMIMVPGTRLHLSKLTCRTLIRILGM